MKNNNCSDFLAIIPARGGSKRLPRKNLLSLGGKPLIAWTIEAALKSSELSKVIVSTEDQEIAQVAKSFGAEVPFVRSNDLASDTSTNIDVVLDILSKIDGYKYVVLLQPTSPMRTSVHIDQAIQLFRKKKASSVTSVCKVDRPAGLSNSLPDDDRMDDFIGEGALKKRGPEIPLRYRINGAIYIADAAGVILKHRSFYSAKNSYAYRMDAESSIDIDTKFDFLLAETLIKYLEAFKEE